MPYIIVFLNQVTSMSTTYLLQKFKIFGGVSVLTCTVDSHVLGMITRECTWWLVTLSSTIKQIRLHSTAEQIREKDGSRALSMASTEQQLGIYEIFAASKTIMTGAILISHCAPWAYGLSRQTHSSTCFVSEFHGSIKDNSHREESHYLKNVSVF